MEHFKDIGEQEKHTAFQKLEPQILAKYNQK